MAPRALAVALALVFGATPALAQPGMTPPRPSAPVMVQAPPPDPDPPLLPGDVNPSTALWYSLGGTLGSYTLVVVGANAGSGPAVAIGSVGTLLAPSFGHWYAGHGFSRGLAMRLLGASALFAGSLLAFASLGSDPSDEGSSEHGNDGLIVGALLVGGGLWIGGTIDDIVTAPKFARRANVKRHALAGYAVMPTLQHGGAGLALVASF
jgi:hypothetical protein